MTAPKPWFWKALFLLVLVFLGVNLMVVRSLREGKSDVVGAASPPAVRLTEKRTKNGEEQRLQRRFRWFNIGGQDPFHLKKTESGSVPPPFQQDKVAPVEETPFVPGILLTATVLMPDGNHKAILRAGAQEQIVQQGEEIQGMILQTVARDYVMVKQGSQVAKIELFPSDATGAPSPGEPSKQSKGPSRASPSSSVPRRGPPRPEDRDAGMNPPLRRTLLKHRPADDWAGLRLRMDYVTPDKGDVRVIGISRSNPAYQAGIRDDDIIQSINGVKPSGLEEVFKMLSDTQPGSSVVVAIERGGFSGTMTVERPLR